MDNLYVIKQKTWSFRFFRFLVLKRKRFFWFQRSHSCSFLLHLLFSLSNHQEIWKKLSSFCCHFVNLNFMHLFFVLSFSCSLFQLFPRDLVHPFSHRVTRLYRFIFCSFIPLEVYTADVIFWGTHSSLMDHLWDWSMHYCWLCDCTVHLGWLCDCNCFQTWLTCINFQQDIFFYTSIIGGGGIRTLDGGAN